MASNRRSRLITQGIARSPNRAMLRAVGFGDDDFTKPIVGVANGHSTMNPCNAGIQPLVDRAMSALHDAGRDAAGVRRARRSPTASAWAPRA
jgi:dihydroxy-acid dehydratase